MMSSGILLLLLSLSCQMCPAASTDRPHILHITVDNLGWSDVEWADGNFVTPNLYKLGQQGVELTNYYVPPDEFTSRIAVATGKDPYTMGYKTFDSNYYRNTNFSLSLDYNLLSSYMKDEGYLTVLVGTWNLGFCSFGHTPLWSGFYMFYGSLAGDTDHYNHDSIRFGGYDLRRNHDVDWTVRGLYSTKIYTDYILKLINWYSNQRKIAPLFITLAYDVIHAPLEAPIAFVQKCKKIKNIMRRNRCAMMAAVDDGVGKIMDAFRRIGEDGNLLVFFSAVNGGPSRHASSNYPLRGFKHTLYEGGSRVNAFIHAPSLLPPYAYSGLMHATDVLPTLMVAAKTNRSRIPTDIDGVSLWDSIVRMKPSPRHLVIYDVDVEAGLGAIRYDRWKLIHNSTCTGNCKTWELYDLEDDPNETTELSASAPFLMKYMRQKYEAAKSKAVPHRTVVVKPKSHPIYYGGVWSPFGC